MLGPLDVARDKDGNVIAPVSDYNPGDAVGKRTQQVLGDFDIGHQIMHRPYREFNDRSVITYQDDQQMAFNSYVPPRSDDPDERWRAQTVRPVTRNKLISIGAQVTARLLIPTTFAQNRDDGEDRNASKVMNDLIEWVINNSNYSRKFLFAVIAALVNPAVILKAEFVEVMRTTRTMALNGNVTSEQVIDTLLSGFNSSVIPVDQLYIANIYEHEIQKQRFLIRREFISFNEAAILYGNMPNFNFVTPGVQVIAVGQEPTFYEQKDDALDGDQVEVVTYYNRGADLQIRFVNGILIDNMNNPNPRIDKLYPFSKSGYEPIDEGQFFYFKSASDKIGPDQELVDTLYNMVMDGTFLQLMPPVATFGDEELDASVFIPGSTHAFREDTRIETIAPKADLRAGINAISEVERSITESSADPRQAGVAGPGEKTAFEVRSLETNARISLGLFRSMIGFLVEDFGTLMVGDVLQHMTVGEVEKIVGGQTKLKYRRFILPDQTQNGRQVSRDIQFTREFDREMSPKETLEESFKLFEEEGNFKAKKKIIKVNPGIFRDLNFKIIVDTDNMIPKNKALEKALNLEAYDRLIQNPLIDQAEVTKDLLIETFRPGESDKFMRKGPVLPGQPGSETQPTFEQGGVNDNMVSQITGNNNLGNTQLEE